MGTRALAQNPGSPGRNALREREREKPRERERDVSLYSLKQLQKFYNKFLYKCINFKLYHHQQNIKL